MRRRLNVGGMFCAHMDDAVDMVARVIEPQHDLILADVDRAQLVEYRQDRRGLCRADPIGG